MRGTPSRRPPARPHLCVNLPLSQLLLPRLELGQRRLAVALQPLDLGPQRDRLGLGRLGGAERGGLGLARGAELVGGALQLGLAVGGL
jgi:hypothetical protein